MTPKQIVSTALLAGALILPNGLSGTPRPGQESGALVESGRLSVYFRDEMVGYEDYVWTGDEFGYTLEVIARMTKPLDLDVERLTIRLNRSFVAQSYGFKGSIGGLDQEVESVLSEGRAANVLTFGGQETRMDAQVRRDAFLLPNPLFSPYLVLTKKFGCGLAEKGEFSAYLIPQMEIPLTVEPVEGAPCRLAVGMGGVRIEIETDADGRLLELVIPSQSLRVKNSGDTRHNSHFL